MGGAGIRHSSQNNDRLGGRRVQARLNESAIKQCSFQLTAEHSTIVWRCGRGCALFALSLVC
jgi:hypothetical protein